MSQAATQPTQQPADDRQQLINIRKRLERWELTHLRALCAELHERLERTEHELLRAQGRAMAAEDAADMWRDQVNELVDDLNALGRTVGLTQTGQLVTMPLPASEGEGVDIDAVHTSAQAGSEAKFNGLHGVAACKHCTYFVDASKEGSRFARCAAPQHGIDPVYGESVLPTCEGQRDSDLPSRCGQSGKFFVANTSVSAETSEASS